MDEIVSNIRVVLRKSVYLHNPSKHGFKLDRVFASLDTIEDTQLAIKPFPEVALAVFLRAGYFSERKIACLVSGESVA